MPTETFTSDGSFDVPTGVSEVEVFVSGEPGQDGGGDVGRTGPGGDGHEVGGTLSTSGGDTLYVRFGGGGNGVTESWVSFGLTITAKGGDGGNAADIRQNGTALSDRVVVGAGGGGGAASGVSATMGSGGSAGIPTGQDASGAGSLGGSGGSQTSGGAGGGGVDTNSGSAGSGGEGISTADRTSPGGGGGGYYGGGGGRSTDSEVGGGGGGSSYTDGLSSVSTSQTTTTSPEVTITYELPPEQPIGISASADDSDTISLSWNAANNADSYNVYRSTSAGVSKSDQQIGSTSSTSFTDTGLNDGTRYHYAVAGVNDVGEGEISADDSALTPLPAPTGLTVANVRATEIDIEWSATHDNGNTRIQIDVDDNGGWSTYETVSRTTESKTISGLLNGQLYGIRVAASTTDAFEVDQ